MESHRGPNMESSESVAVVILNWRGTEDTRECCRSLNGMPYPSARVYVVDNGSGDGSAEALAAEFPNFIHVANRENLGFTRGNNSLIARILEEDWAAYVLLLNNDTVVGSGFLESLVSAARSDPTIGMVGPKIYFFDRPDVIWYAGGRVNFSDPLPVGHIGEGEMDLGQHDRPGETGFVTGCCLLVRSEVIRQIGDLDECFGYYYEDVDWCLRAKRAGWKLWYEPKARVWHKVGRSADRARMATSYYVSRNVVLTARRNLDGMKEFRFILQALAFAWKWPVWSEYKALILEAKCHGALGIGGARDPATPSVFWQRVVYILRCIARVRDFAKSRLRRLAAAIVGAVK